MRARAALSRRAVDNVTLRIAHDDGPQVRTQHERQRREHARRRARVRHRECARRREHDESRMREDVQRRIVAIF